MSVYTWPDYWMPSRFELRVLPNTRTFTGPYTPTVQVVDLLGERWMGTLDLPPTEDVDEVAAREAFFDRLKGQSHQFELFHLRLPVPRGTVGAGRVTVPVVNASAVTVPVVNASAVTVPTVAGDPVLRFSVAQLANTCTIQTRAGRTVKAGDMLGIAGQLVRAMADATANSSGLLVLEFQPRARFAWSAYSPVVFERPKVTVMLRSSDGGVPVPWVPGFGEGISFDFIEVI